MEPRRLSFIHLSGARRGQVDDVSLPAGIGSRPDLAVVVPGTAEYHALLFEREGEVVVRDEASGLGISVDGEAVAEAVLRDGDVIELGADGPKLRFRARNRARTSLSQSMRWARPEGPVHASDVLRFLWILAREFRRRTSLSFRITVAVMLSAGLAAGVFAAWQSHKLRVEIRHLREAMQASEAEQRQFRERIDEERRRFEEERRARVAEAQEFERREQELNQRLAEARAGEVEAVRSDLQATRERLSSLETEKAGGRADHPRLRPRRLPDPGLLRVRGRRGPLPPLRVGRRRPAPAGRRRRVLPGRPRDGRSPLGGLRGDGLSRGTPRPAPDQPPRRRALVEGRGGGGRAGPGGQAAGGLVPRLLPAGAPGPRPDRGARLGIGGPGPRPRGPQGPQGAGASPGPIRARGRAGERRRRPRLSDGPRGHPGEGRGRRR